MQSRKPLRTQIGCSVIKMTTKIDGKESDMKMYKVLGQGLKTMMDFQWKPGQWNEEPDGKKSNNACGIGLHVWKNKPNWSVISYLPDHTYLVEEVGELLGEDEEKARYKKVKISLLPLSLVDLLGQDKKGLSGVNLSRSNLSGSDLSGADFTGTDLSGANLSDADLSGANLSGSYLYGADFTGANLYEANLSGANLSDADLSGANLSDADLYGVNLSRSNLSRSNLRRSDLYGANLSGANLSGAHGIKKNVNITEEQKKSAHC